LQPISNAMRRFDVCANNYQLFAHFRAATILLSTIMQKYLLLLVCFIVSMNVHAGITVVPPEETESDYYQLTLSGSVTASDWTNLSNNVKTAKSLKIVTDGYKLSHDDMVALMGNSSNSLFKDKLQRLDMGDAELDKYSDLALMTNATESTGLIHLKYFVFPKNTDVIPNNPKGMFEDNKEIEEVIMLERDDTNESGFTTVPANTFKNASNLSKVRIPEGVTTIGPSAFGGEQQNVNGNIVLTGPKMSNISFPNSLLYIQANAFANCPGLKSVTIPASVKEIQKFAFQNNINMEDVYIIGDDVKIGFSAFDNHMTYDEFRYNSNGDGKADVVSIWDWKKYYNAAQDYIHPLQLHFANNETARNHYMNLALQILNDPDLPDDVLNRIKETNGNVYYDQNVPGHDIVVNEINRLRSKYGFNVEIKDLIEGSGWVEMDGHRFFTDPDGKFTGESQENDDVNYGGWHNFMFAAADLEKKTWPDKRMIESRWYSAVFPFNLSYNQLMTAYGNGTDVREFTGVERSTNSDGKTVLKITFNDRAVVPVDHDANEDGNTYIIKGHPYMIHPGVRSVPVGEGETAVYRTIAGVSVEEANNVISTEQPLTVLGDLKEGNAIIKSDAYTFVGTYKEEGDYLPEHCYYLGMYTNRPETLGFYYTKSAGKTNKNWKQFTSIVKVSEELEDAGAKFMDMDFSVINHNVFNDDYGIATDITNTSIEQVGTSIIYNLNGQVVGKDSTYGLPKGIYVVNGKKIVVR